MLKINKIFNWYCAYFQFLRIKAYSRKIGILQFSWQLHKQSAKNWTWPTIFKPWTEKSKSKVSVISRAILKPVYRFGIPNSQVLIFGVTFCHCLLLQCHKSNVLSYSEWKIAKIFWGFAPGPHWRRLTAPPRLPSCTTIFLLVMLVEKQTPQKIAAYNTESALCN